MFSIRDQLLGHKRLIFWVVTGCHKRNLAVPTRQQYFETPIIQK